MNNRKSSHLYGGLYNETLNNLSQGTLSTINRYFRTSNQRNDLERLRDRQLIEYFFIAGEEDPIERARRRANKASFYCRLKGVEKKYGHMHIFYTKNTLKLRKEEGKSLGNGLYLIASHYKCGMKVWFFFQWYFLCEEHPDAMGALSEISGIPVGLLGEAYLSSVGKIDSMRKESRISNDEEYGGTNSHVTKHHGSFEKPDGSTIEVETSIKIKF